MMDDGLGSKLFWLDIPSPIKECSPVLVGEIMVTESELAEIKYYSDIFGEDGLRVMAEVKKAVAAEREACAKIAGSCFYPYTEPSMVANEIRARGK
jgi:hypothetical protein